MTDEELRIMERNRRLTRRIMVPLMSLMGACGVAGGILSMAEDTSVVSIGLAFSGLVMSGFAWYYYSDSKKPVERPEKFFVSGVVTKRSKSGDFTRRYYSIELSGGRYKCYITEAEFNNLQVGDRVQCERLVETSVFADRVVLLGRG